MQAEQSRGSIDDLRGKTFECTFRVELTGDTVERSTTTKAPAGNALTLNGGSAITTNGREVQRKGTDPLGSILELKTKAD